MVLVSQKKYFNGINFISVRVQSEKRRLKQGKAINFSLSMIGTRLDPRPGGLTIGHKILF